MVRRWAPRPELLRFEHGTRQTDRGRNISNARWEGPRERSKSRFRFDQSSLITFPPLNSSIKEVLVEGDSAPTAWNSFFNQPKKVSKERVLKFFKPLQHEKDELPFVLASEEAIDREVKKWEKSLVAYVVGKRPHFQALKDRLQAQWKTNADFRMHSLPGGFFLFSFMDEIDRKRVLLEGPWCFYGRPIVIKEWENGLKMEKEQFNALPIWIRLPNLNLSFWDLETLGKISSVIGHPRFIDESTANRDRLDYARICVEITPRCEFPTRVKILAGTKWTDQDIHYEWHPPCCACCNSFDHAGDRCSLSTETEKDGSKQADVLFTENIGEGWKIANARKGTNRKINSVSGVQRFSNQPEKDRRENEMSSFEQGGTSNPFEALQQVERTGAEERGLGVPVEGLEENFNVDGDKAERANNFFCDGSDSNSDNDVSENSKSDNESGDNATLVCETPLAETNSARSVQNSISPGNNVPSCQQVSIVTSTRAGKAVEINQGSGPLVVTTSPVVDRVESSQQDPNEVSFPPGFTPSKEEMLTLRELMKGGATMVPPEHQEEFVKSVDTAEDGEILEFFQEKLNESSRPNYVAHRNVRRSPRMRKLPAKLSDASSTAGLKKGFLK